MVLNSWTFGLLGLCWSFW